MHPDRGCYRKTEKLRAEKVSRNVPRKTVRNLKKIDGIDLESTGSRG